MGGRVSKCLRHIGWIRSPVLGIIAEALHAKYRSASHRISCGEFVSPFRECDIAADALDARCRGALIRLSYGGRILKAFKGYSDQYTYAPCGWCRIGPHNHLLLGLVGVP